ncbi:MAG: hypothetical protein EOM91_03930 [Sphingobacteriia bacterium]|nr:hypothetical protein [Sphingobacteriia bacterium]NCC38448.1 hypothetical protein [Gammaproteobacteria bacterium]
MAHARLLRQRLLLLFLLGLLLLFSPLVLQVEHLAPWQAIPALYLYLFLVWAGLISVAAWIVARART